MSNHKNIKIDKDTLKAAIRCQKDCACANNEWESCSKIDESVNDMILLIAETDDENRMLTCNYHLPFGGEHYCICPARLYIYKNFSV